MSHTSLSLPHQPRVLFCVDLPKWAHDFKTTNLIKNLSHKFDCRKRFHQDINKDDFEWADIIIVYYWKQMFDLGPYLTIFPQKVTLGGISCPTDLEGGAYEIGMNALSVYDAIFVHNQILYDEYRHRIRQPLYLNQNGVDTSFYTPGNHVPDKDKLVVGWAGSLSNHGPKRGYHDIILPAIAMTQGVELRTAAREEKWRGPEEMREFYRSLDVYLVASRVEGTPNPGLESAACGVPSISTAVGNMPEIIRQGTNGFLIDRTPEALSTRLTQLCEDRPLLQSMRQEIRQDIAAWDWSIKSKLYERMIDETLERKLMARAKKAS